LARRTAGLIRGDAAITVSTPPSIFPPKPAQHSVATVSWLPDFCTLPVLLAVMFVVELLVLAIMLAPSDESLPLLPRLGTATVFAQWLALLCVVCLCQLRGAFAALKPLAAVLVAYALILAITLIGSTLVFLLDQRLDTNLTLPA
jgi:two-component system sensor histidine kinase AlgZ